MPLASSSYPLLNVMWTMIVFFAWIVWIWLLVTVFADLFRRKDIGGGKKTLWVLFVLIIPFIGVLAYLIAEGHKMGERNAADAAEAQRRTDEYIKSVASSTNSTDQIAKAKQLLDSGAISTEEYNQIKHKALASTNSVESRPVGSTQR